MSHLLIRTPSGTVLDTGLNLPIDADEATVSQILRDNARTLAEDFHDDLDGHALVEAIDGDTEEVLLTISRERDLHVEDGPGIFLPSLWSADVEDEEEGEEDDFWGDEDPWEDLDD
jgi:hypothetical protein